MGTENSTSRNGGPVQLTSPSLYVFDGFERSELTTYVDTDEVSMQWVEYNRRNGGGLYEVEFCLFCATKVEHFRKYVELPQISLIKFSDDFQPHQDINLIVCLRCGWHRSQIDHYLELPMFPLVDGASAVLQKKKISEDDVPLVELRRYLIQNWGDRREISPGQAESLIADIFKEHLDGEIMYTTNGVFTPDGGVDFVIVNSDSGLEYAFQVKRRLTDKPECVQGVRAFIGAMATLRYSHGYYVTTSPRFTRAAEKMMEDGRKSLENRQMKIDLVDGSRLAEILRAGTCRRPSLEALLSEMGGNTEWEQLRFRDYQWGEEPTVLSHGRLGDYLSRDSPH